MLRDQILIQKREEGFHIKVKYLPADGYYHFDGHICGGMGPDAAFGLIRKAIRDIAALKGAGG